MLVELRDATASRAMSSASWPSPGRRSRVRALDLEVVRLRFAIEHDVAGKGSRSDGSRRPSLALDAAGVSAPIIADTSVVPGRRRAVCPARIGRPGPRRDDPIACDELSSDGLRGACGSQLGAIGCSGRGTRTASICGIANHAAIAITCSLRRGGEARSRLYVAVPTFET